MVVVMVAFHVHETFRDDRDWSLLSRRHYCIAAERSALAAAGENEAWKRKPAKAKKKLKNAQNPSRPLHALLAAIGLIEGLGRSIDFFSISWQFANMVQMGTHIHIIHMGIFKAKMI